MHFVLLCIAALPTLANASIFPRQPASSLNITLINNCPNGISVTFHDEASQVHYLGVSPRALASGESQTISVPDGWTGFLFDSSANCGSDGSGCTNAYFSIDMGYDSFYEIVNNGKFTSPMAITADGLAVSDSGVGMGGGSPPCTNVACTQSNCPANQASTTPQSGSGSNGADPALQSCHPSLVYVHWCPMGLIAPST